MPILNNILDHEVLGREFKKGLQEGREEGCQEGRQEGIEEGLQRGIEEGLQKGRRGEALAILRRIIEKRFGGLPDWAEERLAVRSVSELEDLGERVLDVQSIEQLLK